MFEKKIAWRSTAIATIAAGSQGARASRRGDVGAGGVDARAQRRGQQGRRRERDAHQRLQRQPEAPTPARRRSSRAGPSRAASGTAAARTPPGRAAPAGARCVRSRRARRRAARSTGPGRSRRRRRRPRTAWRRRACARRPAACCCRRRRAGGRARARNQSASATDAPSAARGPAPGAARVRGGAGCVSIAPAVIRARSVSDTTRFMMMLARWPGSPWWSPATTKPIASTRRPLLAFVDGRPDASLLLVNDGSKDATGEVLERLARERPGRIAALQLTPNRGKAEAVREGMRAALAAGAEIVGFLDADLSTPPARDRRPAGGARPARHPGRDRRARRHARVRHPAQRRPPLPRPRVRDRGVDDPAGARLRHPVRGQAVPGGPRAHGCAGDAVPVALGVRRRVPGAAADRYARRATSAARAPSSRFRCRSGTTSRDRSSALAGWRGRCAIWRWSRATCRPGDGRCTTAKILRSNSFFARRNRLADRADCGG